MNDKVLLSVAYFPPIQYYNKLLKYNNIIIEQYEWYPKQSYRNRCCIYGANGLQNLSIPVEKGISRKTHTKDIRIAYHENWQKNHWKSIESAYRSSPFFEFYEDDFRVFYQKKIKFLLDFDMQLMNEINEHIGIRPKISFTNEFIENSTFDDYRKTIHPKVDTQYVDQCFTTTEYHQVFSRKHGFLPNLSILDLMCNLGSETIDYLDNTIKNKT